MKPAPFEYVAPSSLDEALTAMGGSDGDARVLAGGQSLVPLMAFRLAEPSLLVDLRRIPELRRVEAGEDGVLVGAMVTQAALERIGQIHPLVRKAVPLIGHQQIRNRGTVGGSIAHADPAAELPAVAVALGAEMVIRTTSGTRRVAAREFFVTHFTTALGPGEALEAVWFPGRASREWAAIMEVGRRPGDFALAGVGARLRTDEEGLVADVAIVPFAVGDRPTMIAAARERLVGSPLTQELIRAAAAEVASEIDPTSDIHASADYRRHVVDVLTTRLLVEASRPARRSG